MLCQRLSQNYCWMVTSSRLLSAIQNTSQKAELKKTRIGSKSGIDKFQLPKKIINHLDSTDSSCLKDCITKSMLEKSNYSLYLINQDTAKTFSSVIKTDLLKKPSIVIECNPGLGLLTEELLNIGLQSITLYENNSSLLSSDTHLIKLINKYKTQLHLRKENFLQALRNLARDEKNDYENSIRTLLQNAFTSGKQNCVQIITVCKSNKFLYTFLNNFIHQTQLFTSTHLILYIAMPYFVHKRLHRDHTAFINKQYYTHNSVILNLFFDYKWLGELPRKDFIPWPTQTANKKWNEMNMPMCIIKIKPKKNIHHLIDQSDLKAFYNFLKTCLRSEQWKVIQKIEQVIPGSGERLIKQRLNICTLFKDLSHIELLKLFKEVRSWPEYEESLFSTFSASADEMNVFRNEEEDEEEEEDQIFDEGKKESTVADVSNVYNDKTKEETLK